MNLPNQDTIEVQAGWQTNQYLGYQFKVDQTTGTNQGLGVVESGARKGQIEITPASTGVYYLTAVVPASFRNAVNYQVRLTPKGQSSPVASYATNDVIGINHIYQFRFQGPVTLTIETLSGPIALQALFLDRANLIPTQTSSFQLWQKQNFTAADLSNPDLTGMLGDYDHDGDLNLLEYATGTSPVSAGSRSRFLPGIDSWLGNDFLTFQFTKDLNASELTYLISAGSDLADPSSWVWFYADDQTYQVSDLLNVPAKGLETITVRDIVPAGNGPRFMRLSIFQ